MPVEQPRPTAPAGQTTYANEQRWAGSASIASQRPQPQHGRQQRRVFSGLTSTRRRERDLRRHRPQLRPQPLRPHGLEQVEVGINFRCASPRRGRCTPNQGNASIGILPGDRLILARVARGVRHLTAKSTLLNNNLKTPTVFRPVLAGACNDRQVEHLGDAGPPTSTARTASSSPSAIRYRTA